MPTLRTQVPIDQVDHLRLVRTDGIGPITYRRLLERYRTPSAALAALPRLASAGGKAQPPRTPAAEDAVQEIRRTVELGGRLVFLGDAGYPPLLALMDDAPPCLIVLGDAALAQSGCVAVVGGRNASANGQRMAESLAAELAQSLVVASGLARGIDTAAHRGAMRTGRTIAVIAGGIDQPYPPENADLHARIAATNLIVTEAPVGTVPQARDFPRRNRIIAGLSLGVVVVEAALRSGSLITARLAQEAGREVFAVPGSPLDPRARGGNDLIRQGAVLVETAADVLANLPQGLDQGGPDQMALDQRGADQAKLARRRHSSGLHEPGLSFEDSSPLPVPKDAQAEILSLLSAETISIDDLMRRCHFASSVTMAVLLELELAGRVETFPGNRVALLPAAAQ